MTQFNRNVKWKASLSNGETFYEGKKPFELIVGELSPWERLKEYLTAKELSITSLSLYTDDSKNFHLPSSGNNPRFKLFSEVEKPQGFRYQRQMAVDLWGKNAGKEETIVSVWAIYADYELGIVINEDDSRSSWTIVKRT